MLLLSLLVLLLTCNMVPSEATSSCSSGFQTSLSIGPSSTFCIGSGVQNIAPNCNFNTFCSILGPLTEGSSCTETATVPSFTPGCSLLTTGGTTCLSSATEACYVGSGTPLGPAVSGTVAASVTTTHTTLGDNFKIIAGLMPSTSTGGSCAGFVAATGTGTSTTCSETTGACNLPSVALTTGTPQTGFQFAFQLQCTNALQTCSLVSNALAQTSPSIQVCTSDATTTTSPPTTTTATTTSTSTRSSTTVPQTTAPATTTATVPSTTASATNPPASNPCFHEDTIISYKGEHLSLSELKQHSECAIPHIVSAVGSIVTANCGGETKILKLTSGHLLYTQRGLQPAGDLTKDDVLFADMAEQRQCHVVTVEKEKMVQQYFGLNCYESQVLASGLKSSTFEKIHSVPSFWMAIMGRILGIKQASVIGDHIAELVAKLNLI